MIEVLSLSTSRQRFNMLLMTVFGCSALLLAAVGIYGLMAYSVEQRTAEIGIRLALGAEVGGVKRMIMLQGMRLAVVGVIVGVSFAFNLTSFIGRFLFSVKPWDPVVYVTVPAALSVVALLAVWLTCAPRKHRQSDRCAEVRMKQPPLLSRGGVAARQKKKVRSHLNPRRRGGAGQQ